MSRISLGLLLAITLMSAGCGGYSRNSMNGNGMPAITQLMPSTVTANSGAFILTIEGTGFGTDSVAFWGTAARTTTYDSTTQVKAAINADDVMNAGMVQVYVRSGSTNSNMMTITIQ